MLPPLIFDRKWWPPPVDHERALWLWRRCWPSGVCEAPDVVSVTLWLAKTPLTVAVVPPAMSALVDVIVACR
jgi:hypothetical protein